MVAREAMAHGRPVVATARRRASDAVENGVTGVLVPPGDASAMRQALDRLLADAGAARPARAAACGRAPSDVRPRVALGELRRAYDDARAEARLRPGDSAADERP